MSIAGIVLLGIMLVMYTCHCVWVSEAMYSAPSIVMQTKQNDGSVKHFDDFREAYAWLRCAPSHPHTPQTQRSRGAIHRSAARRHTPPVDH